MAEIADLLMLSGVVRVCPDCRDERILLPADDAVAYCCTSCGAAVVIDPDIGPPRHAERRRVA